MWLSLAPFHIAHQYLPGCTFCAVRCLLCRLTLIICCFCFYFRCLLQPEEQAHQIDGGDRGDGAEGNQYGR